MEKLVLMVVGVMLLLATVCSGAEIKSVVYVDKLVDAIFQAEGGYKADYLYGIRSVSYRDEAEARRICMNTVVNQVKRHSAHDCGLSYFECLANRYAPNGVRNDPKGLNRHWLGNVMYFYEKSLKEEKGGNNG